MSELKPPLEILHLIHRMPTFNHKNAYLGTQNLKNSVDNLLLHNDTYKMETYLDTSRV